MPELTIDKKKITAEEGTTILEAARSEGIHIPTLCYHAHLSPVGSCRVCLVEVDGATDPVASCVTAVREGMVVKTGSARITRMRRAMVELMLIDHPLDCSVCDKAGECELQDIVYELGITESEFEPLGASREINEINHFVGRYPNRCILCGRCVRVCEEVQGASVMSYVQRHGYLGEIAVVARDTIECEQCGQCLRVCPVGALIGRDFKYRARVWELAKTRTTCPHCGVGCTLTLNTKQGRIMRVTSESADGAGNNLCVRGRFGVDFVHSEKRLTSPKIRKKGKLVDVSWGEALDAVAGKFAEAKRTKKAMAVLGSARCTNEEGYMLQKFARTVLGTENVDFGERASFGDTLAGIAEVLGVTTVATNSLAAVRSCDAVLVVDADVSEANPVFSLAVQDAVRRSGAKLIVVDSRRTKLARFATSWLRSAPGSEDIVLGAIVRRVCEKSEAKLQPAEADVLLKALEGCTLEGAESASGVDAAAIAAAADTLARSSAAAVIISSLAGRATGALAADLAVVGGNVLTAGGVYVVGLSSNSQGALDMGMSPGPKGKSATEMVRAAAGDELRAAYIMGDDLTGTDADAVRALSDVEFVVVQDVLEGPLTEIADVVLPGAAFAEKSGTFTNMERLVQRVRPAIQPPGRAKPDIEILADLASRMGSDLERDPAAVMTEIAGDRESYAGVTYESLGEGGVVLPAIEPPKGFPKLVPVSPEARVETDEEYAYCLVTGQRRFHSGAQSRAAKGLSEAYPEPLAEMSHEDAQAIGAKDGTRVNISSPGGRVTARVKITAKSVSGTVFVPYGFEEAPVAQLLGWNGSARATKTAVKVEKA